MITMCYIFIWFASELILIDFSSLFLHVLRIMKKWHKCTSRLILFSEEGTVFWPLSPYHVIESVHSTEQM